MKKIKYLLILLILFPITVFGLEKEEVIFSTLNYKGSVKSLKVTNHIKDNSSEIIDNTSLTDILNISGEESFIKEGNTLKWTTTGSDIIYRGTTTKSLPIDTKITYYLDGKKTSVKKILGKKGHIEIKLEFINNDINTVNLNGNVVNLYTPFVTTIGTYLSSSETNISITNGKVINNGINNLLISVATPGMYDNTKLNLFKEMDSTIISYDTDSFSLNNIYIISTPKLLEESDTEIFDKIDNLTSSMTELKSGMDTILNGSSMLESGSTLLMTKLQAALELLNNDCDALTEEQVIDIKNQTINTVKLKLTDEYKDLIGSSAGDKAVEKTKLELDNNILLLKNEISSLASSVQEYIENLINNNTDYKTIINSIDVSKFNLTEDEINSIKQVLYLLSTKAYLELTDYKLVYDVAYNTAIEAVEMSAIETASSVSEDLSKEVANEVKSTMLSMFKDNMNTLYSGIKQLDDGIKTLDTGLNKFNNEGISVLYNYSNKLDEYSNIFEALKDLSSNYQGYTSNNANKVLFISKVESLK